MEFVCGKQEMRMPGWSREQSVLLGNGLGGYASVTGAWGVSRCDQGILVAAVKAPNVRITLVHRMKETLRVGDSDYPLSTQTFADGTPEERGLDALTVLRYDALPRWTYWAEGVEVVRTLALRYGENTAALRYEIRNEGTAPCTLTLEPFLKFAPKEDAVTEKRDFTLEGNRVTDGAYTLYIHTEESIEPCPTLWQTLSYPEDAKDGRPGEGLSACCCRITRTVGPGETGKVEVIFSTKEKTASTEEIIGGAVARQKGLEESCGLADPIARALAAAADVFLADRESTAGKTILAGYPLFSDWGRDTMIALPGCALATGRYEEAKSILKTFLHYEKDGLVPNLFPEGDSAPMYNTVDAALLLIDCVWLYANRTEDWDFVREAWGCLERIIASYRRGTHHAIAMEEDGLIRAGEGLDQVTWMDVCVNGILPTPRHGKPVEVNAYWYNALRIMDELGKKLSLPTRDYALLAERVKASFREKFYMPEKGYLKDVLSGTEADEQLRCNQIWAVSMAFTMLSRSEERNVVAAVGKALYTPCGLRTLSPSDRQYRGFYGGEQLQRDMAYHQGTVWVFPMGAYWRAWLKVNGNAKEAAAHVRRELEALIPMLREGCLGQLPEIYDGDFPSTGKGCYAQAWSVGEMLRVFDALRIIEEG